MAVPYKNLYYSTDELISRFKPSLSAYFSVFIPGNSGTSSNDSVNFLAYEAVLPGTSFQTTEVYGDRQGITETFANKRVYPPVDVSFYIDYEYDVIEYFEQWIGAISPNIGSPNSGGVDSFVKFEYPTLGVEGKKRDIIITKFERNFRKPNQRLVKGGVYNMPDNRIEYTLLGAYPTNIISIPISYEQSTILRTTITFNYNLYRFKRHKSNGETSETLFSGSPTASSQPGGDSGITLGDLNRQSRPINENSSTVDLERNFLIRDNTIG